MILSLNSTRLLSCLAVLIWHTAVASQTSFRESHACLDVPYGGSSGTTQRSSLNDAFQTLAVAIEDRLQVDGDGESADLDAIARTLKSLSSAQKALKGLDGAAHEAYQRTHDEASVDASVSGRARRSAARAGSTADALFAAELCELLEHPHLLNESHENSTLAGRLIVMNITDVKMTKEHNVSVLVLYEPDYSGGVGLEHGGIEDLASTGSSKSYIKRLGRLLVIVGDRLASNLPATCAILDAPPMAVQLHAGLVASELASVQGTLYRTAGRLLQMIEPTLRAYNESAVHFVGRSLAGGVAGLGATILDGSLPMPPAASKKHSRTKSKKRPVAQVNETAVDEGNNDKLEGLGRGRSSAMILGAPPCLSANVKAAFVKSIIYGDDVVCRTTQESLDRLCIRTKRALAGGFLGRRVGWMADTVSLTMSGFKSHAHGSEGEEARLAVPGQAFLIRPRRLGGTCSMHEIGGLKGGREALRAAVLWQLHDVLLSRSMWSHHQLDSYIHGLDRVSLRGFDERAADESYY